MSFTDQPFLSIRLTISFSGLLSALYKAFLPTNSSPAMPGIVFHLLKFRCELFHSIYALSKFVFANLLRQFIKHLPISDWSGHSANIFLEISNMRHPRASAQLFIHAHRSIAHHSTIFPFLYRVLPIITQWVMGSNRFVFVIL